MKEVEATNLRREFMKIRINFEALALPDPLEESEIPYDNSTRMCHYLIQVIRKETTFEFTINQ